MFQPGIEPNVSGLTYQYNELFGYPIEHYTIRWLRALGSDLHHVHAVRDLLKCLLTLLKF